MGEVVQLVRVGLVGAAGMLGREVLSVLERRKAPVMELVPIGSEGSVGDGIDYQSEDLPLRPPETELKGLDWVFLCAPVEASREHARRALHAEVPALDLSGAFAAEPGVALLDVERLPEEPAPEDAAPLVSVAGGAALAISRVLAPLDAALRLTDVQITLLESASTAGHRAFTALSTETVALLSQQEAPEPEALPWPLAFDVHAATDEEDVEGRSAAEAALAPQLERLVREDLDFDCTILRIPTFTGEGALLSLGFEAATKPADVEACLGSAAGVEALGANPAALRTRAATGREDVLVGRVRPQPAGRIQLWLAADTQRLTADNAVRLAERRNPRPTE